MKENGKKETHNGTGKSYNKNGNIDYDGEWKDNSSANGTGKFYYDNGNNKI